MLDAKLSTLARYFAGLGYQIEITLTPLEARYLRLGYSVSAPGGES